MSVEIGADEGCVGAEHEINLWWKPEEVLSWNTTIDPWVYESK